MSTRWLPAALTVLPAFLAVAESLPPTVAEPALTFSDRTAVSWVLVPVVVREGGRYVTRLEADDFRLWVDDRPLAFETFDRDPAGPISLIHLQDLSGSMAHGGRLEAGRRALECFLDRTRPGDEVALATFASGRTDVEVPFTGDTAIHREALALWRAYGTTALHDAVAWLPDISVEGRNVRHAAVLVTDGADNASALAPGVARDLVRQARLPVYVLALDDGGRPRVGEPPARDETMLRLLAHLTGGRYFPIDAGANDIDDDRDAIADACAEIADELRHRYVLGFRVHADGAPSYHRLRVAIERGDDDLEIIHRQGYHGGPP